ncbi:MAG: dihydrodipicolinate synthase family protein [Actinobacteria bacterium]|nr:dihydrodipicolinate synthase family protein [Actinomycetota bacterium]
MLGRGPHWHGVFPATLCPFTEDFSIDERELTRYAHSLANTDGIKGLVCNGHTGECGSLLAEERAEVARIMVEAVQGKVPIVTGVTAEGTAEAVRLAEQAQDAGATGLLIMPPHMWLRFGRQPDAAYHYFKDIAASTDLDIIVHQYPLWTKAHYFTPELLKICSLDRVVAVKNGDRDLARYEFNLRAMRRECPDVAILSCHDEYLMATLLVGADGALVGFAGFVPELIVALTRACLAGNLPEAQRVQERIFPLTQAVYRMGEPSATAHARMKEAMVMLGRLKSARARPPVIPMDDAERATIRSWLEQAGMLTPAAMAAS